MQEAASLQDRSFHRCWEEAKKLKAFAPSLPASLNQAVPKNIQEVLELVSKESNFLRYEREIDISAEDQLEIHRFLYRWFSKRQTSF